MTGSPTRRRTQLAAVEHFRNASDGAMALAQLNPDVSC